MREVVFVDFARTAFGNRGGSLRTFSACTLAAECLKGLVKKSGIWEKGGEHAVDAIFLGSANRSKDSSAPARYSALLAGFPVETEAHQVEMQCGSAITSINHAAFQIALGYTDVAIAGGMESASTKPVFMSATSEPYKGIAPPWLSMRLAPTDDQNISMIAVADGMAQKWGITRTQCDEFALASQQRLAAAYASGLIGPEIVPVTIPATRKTPEVVVDKDEFPKPNSTLEILSGLRAVGGGVTTAGNASGINDGAAFVLMMTAEKAKELGYTPYARWVMGADIGVEPKFMGIGPAFSNAKALKLAGLSAADMDVWECNEAFAAQNLAVVKELENLTGHTIDMAKWNPNGGAIAIGHPNGASGARITQFAMKQLEKCGGRYGIISSCCGGGHGTTTIIENLRR
jgi:acetyl-CoA C-acetyltransferase